MVSDQGSANQQTGERVESERVLHGIADHKVSPTWPIVSRKSSIPFELIQTLSPFLIELARTLKRWIYERRTLNSGYNKAFNNNFVSNRNHYLDSPIPKHLKENHSIKNHPTQQFGNHANGYSSNRPAKSDKLFSNDKITILKNPKNRKNSTCSRFWSESLMNFDMNLDALWKGCVREYLDGKTSKV